MSNSSQHFESLFWRWWFDIGVLNLPTRFLRNRFYLPRVENNICLPYLLLLHPLFTLFVIAENLLLTEESDSIFRVLISPPCLPDRLLIQNIVFPSSISFFHGLLELFLLGFWTDKFRYLLSHQQLNLLIDGRFFLYSAYAYIHEILIISKTMIVQGELNVEEINNRRSTQTLKKFFSKDFLKLRVLLWWLGWYIILVVFNS